MRLVTRRQMLRLFPGAAGIALVPAFGCRALAGEETIEAFIDVPKTNNGQFNVMVFQAPSL